MICPKCGIELTSEDLIEAEPDVGITCTHFYCGACDISIDEEGDEI